MSSFIYPLLCATYVFPIITLILMLPYIGYQYHSFGSVRFLRAFIIFSFFYYLLCAYALVILPFPTDAQLAMKTGNTMNLQPFSFVPDVLYGTKLNIKDPQTYYIILNDSKLYEPLFNIFLTLPFGIYLRYYFRKGPFKTIFYSFLLSLFFELTQLSGLYGFFPRPYRLFDVNDLINNTLGGTLGYLITPIVTCLLPSKEQLDHDSYQHGQKVSYFRRFFAIIVDMIPLFIISFSITFYFPNNLYMILLFPLLLEIAYFTFLPFLTHGYTLGKFLVKIKIVSLENEKKSPKFFHYLIRSIFLHGFIFNLYRIVLLLPDTSKEGTSYLIAVVASLLPILLFPLYILKETLFKRSVLFYEKRSHTKQISTIS